VKAEPLFTQALRITKNALGENHPSYAGSFYNLAELYRAMGTYEKAEPLVTQAVRITKNALGENHPTYAKCLNGLAMVYQFMGEYERPYHSTPRRGIYTKKRLARIISCMLPASTDWRSCMTIWECMRRQNLSLPKSCR